jgi:hypothetical protein
MNRARFGPRFAVLCSWLRNNSLRSAQTLELKSEFKIRRAFGSRLRGGIRQASESYALRCSRPARPIKASILRQKKPVGWSALLDRSVSVSRNGKQIKMHAYEAMLHGLAKQALQGQIRALRQLMKLFKEAGLLEAPPPPKTHGVLEVPKGVPMELAVRLIRLSGPPPWDADLFDETKAEYEADCAHIEKLNKETEEKYRELGLL